MLCTSLCTMQSSISGFTLSISKGYQEEGGGGCATELYSCYALDYCVLSSISEAQQEGRGAVLRTSPCTSQCLFISSINQSARRRLRSLGGGGTVMYYVYHRVRSSISAISEA
jgi:hypothetical protein